MYGGLLVPPLYFQLATGRGATEMGLLLLAMGLGSAVALHSGGKLTDRYGAGPVTTVGSALLVAATLPFHLPEALPQSVLVTILVVCGIGLAMAQMPAMTAAYTAVSADRMGDATTLANIVQRLGGAIGAAGLVILLAPTGGNTARGSYTWAFAALPLISTITLVPAIALWNQLSDRHADARATAIHEEVPATSSHD